MDDNQITAFHPGAMSCAHLNRIADAPGVRLAIVSPDGRQGMVEHVRDLAAAKVRYIFDPGQGLPMFEGADLLAMMDGAAALTVNDYEARVVEQKTGRSVEQIAATMEAVVVTRGAEGSSVYAKGRRSDIPAVKPRRSWIPRDAETPTVPGCSTEWRAAGSGSNRPGSLHSWALSRSRIAAARTRAVAGSHHNPPARRVRTGALSKEKRE